MTETTLKFSDLNLHEHLQKAINTLGFDTPTPVQQQSIPHIMTGVDLMACAQTGTGKTAAFSLPLAHRLLSNLRGKPSKNPRAVVLTPTRELADQVLANIQTYIKGSPLKAGLVVGGMPYGPQINMLQRPLDILVATPGRLIDHLEERRVNLSEVEVFVLDEADRMLDMGFVRPVEKILSHVPKERQTLLFSATFDKRIDHLAQQFLREPVQVRLAAATQEHKNIKQSMLHAKVKEDKTDLLREQLADPDMYQSIVFMRTKHSCDKMAKRITGWGYEADALHGDMRQNARKRVIEKMHKNKLQVLVATDVAARGLDVKTLTHVFNYDLPQVAEDYIHRIGRVGRAGEKGVAVSFVARDEKPLLRAIEKMMETEVEALNEDPYPKRDVPFGRPKTKTKRGRARAKRESKDFEGGKESKPKFGKKKSGKGQFGSTPPKSKDSRKARKTTKTAGGKPQRRKAA